MSFRTKCYEFVCCTYGTGYPDLPADMLLRLLAVDSAGKPVISPRGVNGTVPGLQVNGEWTELRDRGIQGVDTKLLKELGEDNIEQSIIGEEIAQLSEEYDLRAITWRQRMVHFLHTMPVEVFMMTLVVIDVIIILGMVVLDMYILEEQLELLNKKGTEVLTYLNNTWPNGGPHVLHEKAIDQAYEAMVTYLKSQENSTFTPHGQAGSHSIHERSAGPNLSPDKADYGQTHSYEAAKMIYNSKKANHILHYCSIAILAVFVVEVGLKIIGYGKSYFKNKWELIDGIVILISFSLDVAVTDANFSHEVGKTVLVVFLIWRVIRILNAMVLTSRARTMFRLRVLRKSKKVAEDKNKLLAADLADLQNEVGKLRLVARAHGADDHEIISAQVLSKTSVSSTKAGLKNMMAQLLHLNTNIATVSCTSLNKLNLNGYSRSRRPSMIGDQTMCRDVMLASQTSQLESTPMRQRAVSDAGCVTARSKLRENLKARKLGNCGIPQAGSTPIVKFDDILTESGSVRSEDSLGTSNCNPAQCYTVVDETAGDKAPASQGDQSHTTTPATLAKDSLKRSDSGIIVVERQQREESARPKTPEKAVHSTQKPEVEGHTNHAFSEDDVASSSSEQSQGSADSGLSLTTADIDLGVKGVKGKSSEGAKQSANQVPPNDATDVETTPDCGLTRVSPVAPISTATSSKEDKPATDSPDGTQLIEKIFDVPDSVNSYCMKKPQTADSSSRNTNPTADSPLSGKKQSVDITPSKKTVLLDDPDSSQVQTSAESNVQPSTLFLPQISITNTDDHTIHPEIL